ncbi:MAG: HAD family hydrolase [Candidatus Dormibacteraeota bacterium]|nr:HAD family hydrolase [Candidatus Dormibacteraeota bacterium]
MPLRAVVFDLDDTLLAATRARIRANRVLRELGIHPLRWRAVGDRWWRRYVQGEISSEELRHGRWHALGLDGEAALAADTAWRAVAFDSQFRTGARALLRQVRDAGLRTAILTNGTIDPQRRKIEKHGLVALVDLVVVTEEIGVHKPDPGAFSHILAGLDVAATDAAMVGDDLRNDVDGALAADFRQVVWLTRRPIRHHPDARVTVVNGPREVPGALGLERR